MNRYGNSTHRPGNATLLISNDSSSVQYALVKVDVEQFVRIVGRFVFHLNIRHRGSLTSTCKLSELSLSSNAQSMLLTTK